MKKLGLVMVVLAACGGGGSKGNGDGSVNDGATPDGGGGGDATMADARMVDAMPDATAAGMLTVSPPTRDFGTVAVASSAMVDFAVRNEGGLPIGPVVVTPAGDTTSFVVASDDCSGQTLAPAGLCTIRVRFMPASYGPKTGSLSVSAGGGGSVTVPLTGIGRDTVTLTVTQPFGGNGTGSIAGAGISCPGTCTATVPRMDATAPMVTLTATIDISSTLTWGGACSGSSPTCTLTMDANTTVSATFTKKRFTLTTSSALTAGGLGTLTSAPAGINCPGVCSQTAMFDYGTVVTLTAAPSGASYVKAWTGDCTALTAKCTLTMTANHTAGVTLDHMVNNFMFTTSTKVMPGSLSSMDPLAGNDGLRGGDAYCQAAAVEAGLGGHYVAFLSTPSVNASAHLGGARGWVRRDGRPFADTTTALFGQAYVYYPPSLDEHAMAIGGTADVATGTVRSGVAAANTCAGWTTTTGIAALGNSKNGGDGWTDFTVATTGSCGIPYRLYCFGTDLTAPLSYVRATGRQAFLSANTMLGGTSIASADALCAAEANTYALTGTFKAFMSSTTASAASRFSTTGLPWVRTDGVALVANAADLFVGTGPMQAALNIAADGTTSYGLVFTWVGSSMPMVPGSSDDTCTNWTSASSTIRGMAGRSHVPNIGATDGFSCDTPWHVFCLQQ